MIYIYIYTYICIHTCVHIYIYIYTHIHSYIHIHVSIRAAAAFGPEHPGRRPLPGGGTPRAPRASVYMIYTYNEYINIYVCMYVRVYIYIYIYICIYIILYYHAYTPPQLGPPARAFATYGQSPYEE